jgi:hypothetical protein
MKKYFVELTPEQREELSQMISTGTAVARELTPDSAESGSRTRGTWLE